MIHSSRGASKSSRWDEEACPASVSMSEGIEDETNPAAELGTAVHEMCEFCLKIGLNAYDCLGLEFNKSIMTSKEVNSAQLYISLVRSICIKYGVNPKIEIKVIISSISEYVFGTADCVIIAGRRVIVIDYKNGYEVVEVDNNSQAEFYGVGVLDTFKLWDKVDDIETIIVQPNSDHIDGSIRKFTYTINDMIRIQKRFERSVNATYDPSIKPNAGKWCKYCLASGNCYARIMRTLRLAFHDSPMDQLSNQELFVIYKEIPSIKKNMDKISSKILQLAREGVLFEDHKLVKSIQRATCVEEKSFIEAANKLILTTESLDISTDDLYHPRKLISMTEAKKKLKNYKLVNKYYIKPPPSTTLVRITDSRPAVSNIRNAVGIFDPIEIKVIE